MRTDKPGTSDFPKFARWLVEQDISSILLNPDVAIRAALVIAAAEAKKEASAA
jgi:phosphoenolpyruvate synthase/pyruvate phosphate dikinase